MFGARFYTYALIDPRDGLPFYVGKGSGKRMYRHTDNSHNPHVRRRISEIVSSGLKVIHEKLFESEDETLCFLIEILAIDFFGRIALLNLTNGGEGLFLNGYHRHSGNSGSKHYLFGKKQSKETLAKRFPKDRKPYHLGLRHSPETRAKMRHIKIGKCRPRTELEQQIDTFENEGGFVPGLFDRRSLNNKGAKNGFFGKKHSQEVCNAMKGNTRGRANKGRVCSEETCQKNRLAKLGKKRRPFSEEHRRRMSTAKRGSKNGMFGKVPWNKKPTLALAF